MAFVPQKSAIAQRIAARYEALQKIRNSPQFSPEAKAKAYCQIEDGVALEEIFGDLQASLNNRAMQEV